MRSLFVAFTALLSLACPTQAQPSCDQSTITPELTVKVYDYAEVPAPILAKSESETSSIFAARRIHLLWTHPALTGEVPESPPSKPESPQLSAVLKILSKDQAEPLHPEPHALGYTIPGTSFIFYDRVRTASAVLPVAVVLGYVTAHELGHVLGLQHSIGIMSRAFPRAWLRSGGEMFGFTGVQANEMRTRLRTGDRIIGNPCPPH